MNGLWDIERQTTDGTRTDHGWTDRVDYIGPLRINWGPIIKNYTDDLHGFSILPRHIYSKIEIKVSTPNNRYENFHQDRALQSRVHFTISTYDDLAKSKKFMVTKLQKLTVFIFRIYEYCNEHMIKRRIINLDHNSTSTCLSR